MFRLLGFLIGSITAITIILAILGLPEFHLGDPEVDQQRFDAAVEKLKAKQQEAVEVAEEVAARVSDAVAIESLAVEQPVTTDEPSSETVETPVTTVQAPLENAPAGTDEQWYSFWNPFRSEIAARGFVAQLEKVTGLDYRVVKVKTGVYEVAFAYADDAERRSKLTQISAATGLELPES